MDARFRVRTTDQRELLPPSLEEFATLVREGRIREGDLIYDALTGEWTPAWVHPVFQMARDGHLFKDGDPDTQAPAAATAGEPDPAPAPFGSLDGVGDLDLELDLVEHQPPSPEDEARAFMERMKEERRAEEEAVTEVEQIPLVDARSADVGAMLPSPPPARPAPAQSPVLADDLPLQPTRPRAPGPRSAAPQSAPGGRPVRGPVAAPRRAPPRRRAPGRVRRWAGLATLLVATLALTATVARPAFRVGDALPARAGGSVEVVRPPRPVSSSEAAVRGQAHRFFLLATERLRRELGVGPVPGRWLEGRYLAEPGAYPEIRAYWSSYLNYVETARQREEEVYAQAYHDALSHAGVAGAVARLRLATAVEDFRAGRAARDEAYARAWEVAAAALSLHDTLVDLEGRISYEPARGTRLSADPVLEATGTDDESRVRLRTALDRVLDALYGVEGSPVTVIGRQPTWLVDALRAAEEGETDGSPNAGGERGGG